MNPFSSKRDLDLYLRFRETIIRGDAAHPCLFLNASRTSPARAVALARFLGDLSESWASFSCRLSAGLVGDPESTLILAYDSVLLPGGRGMLLLIAHFVEHKPDELAAVMDRMRRDMSSGRRLWSVWVGSSAGNRPPVEAEAVELELAPVLF